MRPRFKEPVSGFTHLAGFMLAVAGVAWLAVRGACAGVLVYGASLVALYAASSAYHLVPGGKRVARMLRAFDHVAIFLLVAGTCTPVLSRALEGTARVAMLASIWGAAAVGIVLRASWRRAPRAVYTALYVAMGWMAVLRWTDLRRALPVEVVALILAGGIVYTLGAVVYALRRPNPFPRVFGFHEIWHLFVLGGSALHFAAVAALR
jgi:hemolysin III